MVVSLAAIYAACYSAIKEGLQFAPPLRFAGIRAGLAGVLLMALIAMRREEVVCPRRLWRGVALIAMVGTSIAYGAMFLSPNRSSAGIASVLGNIGPLFSIVLAAAVLGEPMTRARIGALTLGLAGVGLIAYPTITAPAAAPLGAVLPLLAALASSVESVLVKRMQAGTDFLRVAAWQLLIGSVPLLLLSEWVEGEQSIVWNRTFVLLLLFLAVIGTALATSLWYWLVQSHDVGRLSLYQFLVPVLGLALAAALFGERLGIPKGSGVVLTLLGLGWALRDPARQDEEAKRN